MTNFTTQNTPHRFINLNDPEVKNRLDKAMDLLKELVGTLTFENAVVGVDNEETIANVPLTPLADMLNAVGTYLEQVSTVTKIPEGRFTKSGYNKRELQDLFVLSNKSCFGTEGCDRGVSSKMTAICLELLKPFPSTRNLLLVMQNHANIMPTANMPSWGQPGFTPPGGFGGFQPTPMPFPSQPFVGQPFPFQPYPGQPRSTAPDDGKQDKPNKDA